MWRGRGEGQRVAGRCGKPDDYDAFPQTPLPHRSRSRMRTSSADIRRTVSPCSKLPEMFDTVSIAGALVATGGLLVAVVTLLRKVRRSDAAFHGDYHASVSVGPPVAAKSSASFGRI